MIKLFGTALLISFSSLLQAQKPPIKFGDIPMDQLEMTRYEKDSSAAAVVLTDYGQSTMDYSESDGFVLQFERLTRIKILTKDGLDYANFSIPLYHTGSSNEKLSGLKAVTYNLENGKIVEVKLKNEAVFKEKQDANVDIMKITLPNVKSGSIVEITYKVRSDFLFNFQDWEFQSAIPIVWSEYRAQIPEYFNYEKYMQGYVPLTVNENTTEPNSITIHSKERSEGRTTQTTFTEDKIDFQESRFRWAAKDVPAFKPEPFITTARDYISKMNFELSFTRFPNQPMKNYMGSWEDINKTYAESDDFGSEVTGNGFLKKIVEEITAGRTSPEDKIGAICNYIKQTVAWDGTNRKYIGTSLKNVLDEKKGNSAAINLLLASMLEKADLKVSPVLLSTRDHGFVREATPASSQFNYVICLVRLGDKLILLDATDKLLPTGTLPEKCLNGNGLVVSKDGFEWVKLQSSGKSRRIVNADLILENEGELKGKLLIERTGYYAHGSRKNYFSKGEADYQKDFLGSRSWELSKSEYQNANEIQQSFKEAHELTISDHITSTGEMIYLSPFVMDQEEENPFKLEERQYPVDFGSPFDRMYVIKITIPDNYNVEELPKSKAIALPNSAAKYFYNVSQVGNIINITSNLAVNRSLFVQDEYANLREFYNQIVAKQAEQIVLKKK
jgi:transglutaminase-like putative cysteine protease